MRGGLRYGWVYPAKHKVVMHHLRKCREVVGRVSGLKDDSWHDRGKVCIDGEIRWKVVVC